MAMPCTAMEPLRMILSPGRARLGSMFTPFGTTPMPDVLMKILSALPRSTTFVSPVTSVTPAASAASRIDCTTRREIVHRQAFLEDEADREMQRARAAHGEIVDRAVDGQLADVAAREKDRADDVGIGAEGEPRVADGKERAVVKRFEQVVAELRQDDVLHQLLAQLAAAAVREDDLLIVGSRQRAAFPSRRCRPHPERSCVIRQRSAFFSHCRCRP